MSDGPVVIVISESRAAARAFLVGFAVDQEFS